jgi:hypothetical protein
VTVPNTTQVAAWHQPVSSKLPQVAGPRFIACIGGAACGVFASILRLGPSGVSGLAGGIAFWAAIGFLISRIPSNRQRAMQVSTLYLAAWLLSYYASQTTLIDGANSRILGAAVPWFVLLLPGGCLLGLLANTSRRRNLVGDICLTLPLAWSAPEAFRDVLRGPAFVPAAAATLAVAAIPFVLERRHPVNPLTVTTAFSVVAALFAAVGELVMHARFLSGI